MRITFLHLTMGLIERGSEISTDLLASELAKRHDVLVIQSGPVGQKPYRLKRVMPLNKAPAPAPRTLLDKLRSRLYLDDGSFQIRRFTRAALPTITQFAPDIIVATNGSPQLRILQGQALQAKIVAFGHAGIGYHDRDTLRAHPDLFIALTPAAYTWAQSFTTEPTKVIYIPNPINISKSKNISLNLPHPIILCVGALSKYKNIDQVITAAKELSVSLFLIGDGEESATISKLLGSFPGDFRWIRHVDPSEIGGYYASADAFCFVPDPQEAFGRVYLEAMAAGLPIVASDDPIRRALIGVKGIYVDPHDPVSIAGGINQALKLGKLNYSHQLKPYALNRVVSQLEKELHDLIK